MASGYTNSHPRDEGDFYFETRFYWESSYNASTNTSTVTFRPQIYTTTNMGNDLRMFNPKDNGGGIYRDGSKIYSFPTYFSSGNYLRTWSNPYDSWVGLFEQGDAFPSLTVQHDSNGNASIKLGLRCGVISMNDYSGAYSSWLDSGYYIDIAQSRTLNVSYNANGGSGAPSATYFYGSTESIVLSSTRPTRTGYTFLGWSTSSTATTATYSPGQNIGTRSSSLPLYAVWQINTYTISFDANEGEGAPEAVTKTYGIALTLPDAVPTRTGYDFLGWSTDSTATTATYQAGGSFTTNAVTTLYAVWRVISYTLSATISDRGITANILRTASPIGGAASGLLANGDTIYYGDVVKVSWALSGGYQAETLEIDGVDVSAQTEQTVTVTHALSVILVVELGAMVYISNDMYQVFINDGTGWSQYQAFIGNGSSWEAY